MKEFMRQHGFIFVIIAMIPAALIVNIICKILHIDTVITVTIQMPFLFIQILSLVLMIIYRKEIWGLRNEKH